MQHFYIMFHTINSRSDSLMKVKQTGFINSKKDRINLYHIDAGDI